MPLTAVASRSQVWLDALEWSWPRARAEVVELAPPAWVPSLPARRVVAVAPAGALPLPAPARGPGRAAARRRALALAAVGLAALAALAVALNGRLAPTSAPTAAGVRAPARVTRAVPAPAPTRVAAAATSAPAVPALTPVSRDRAGSSIASASFASWALHGTGSFLVYLPLGYAGRAPGTRYPVLYLLPGHGEGDSSFLTLGLQQMLDRLTAQHWLAPMIAVMIQGGPGSNDWRNERRHHYESYVVEVQQLVDRMLPTVPDRSGRAIAGYSMGGFGAMNVALSNLDRFSAVESWLGFFDGLGPVLRADRAQLRRMPLHAFVYGGASDPIADPRENAPFASALRTQGAAAQSAVYPGGHSFATLHAHLGHMLMFAGRALAGAS